MDIFSDHVDPTRDVPRERTIEFGTNPFRVRADDPYGFWSIHRDKGQVPERLSGHYTSYEKAAQAVDLYIRTMPQTQEKPSGKVSNSL